jgi:hypothetical protein
MSRFAKLVNAKAAREQEPQRETVETTANSLLDKALEAYESQPTPVITPVATPALTPVSTPATTPVTTGATTPATGTVIDSQREPARTSPQYLDATHTASEQRVYSVMYRETVSRGVRERHFGPKELCERTGIRSDRTIRTALDGLIEKLSIEIVSHANGSPLGPRYRVFDPREIVSKRKAANIEIDTQSKKITTPVITGVTTGAATGDKNYRGTPVESTGVTGVDFAGVYTKYINTIGGDAESAAGSSSNIKPGVDDEAYAILLSNLRSAVKDVTGRESTAADAERWGELAELLVTELKIAAGRTGSISSVPAFLTEHLRRRLWKREKREVEDEGSERREAQAAKVDASQCPDCFGTGMWYPEGFDKGVARCAHEKLTTPAQENAAPEQKDESVS